jgi:hypothetical protein
MFNTEVAEDFTEDTKAFVLSVHSPCPPCLVFLLSPSP